MDTKVGKITTSTSYTSLACKDVNENHQVPSVARSSSCLRCLLIFLIVAIVIVFSLIAMVLVMDFRSKVKPRRVTNYLNKTDYDLPPMKQLQKLLTLRPEVAALNFTDTFLLPFLDVNNHDVHQAEEHVLNYVQARRQYGGHFVNASTAQALNKPTVYWPYWSGHRPLKVVYFKMANWQHERVAYDKAISVYIPFSEYETATNSTYQQDTITIMDMSDFSFSQLLAIEHSSVRIASDLSDALPVRQGTVHIVNHDWVFKLLFQIGQEIVSSARQESFVFHDHLDGLRKYLNATEIPEVLGGSVALQEPSAESLRETDAIVEKYWRDNPV